MVFTVSKWDTSLIIPDLTIQKGIIGTKILKPSLLYEEGGSDWTVIFSSKPNRNYWDLPISKLNLALLYQPALTEDFAQVDCEIWTPTYVKTKTGLECFRPPEMIGGYVAYHKTLRNNSYKNGKIFNLLIPKATDKNGLTVFGSYNRDAQITNILRVMLPQAFLDSAVYPVVVDPTFGYTSIGASSSGDADNYKQGATFTEPAGGGTITLMTAYVKRSGAGNTNTKAGLYGGYSGDAPITLLASSAEVSVGDTYSWVDFSINYIFAGGNKIWLGLISEFAKTIAYDGGDANQGVYRPDTYSDGFSDPFGAPLYVANKYSIYATYTTVAKAALKWIPHSAI